MADEPFWPGLNPSCASRTSVRCRCRSSTAISAHVAPSDAHAYRYSLCRSRAITWVAGDRRQAERVTHMAFDRRWHVRVGTDGAAELHHRHGVTCRAQAGAVAVDLQGPERRPWRRRSSVRRARRGSVRSSPCRRCSWASSIEHGEEPVDLGEQDVGGVGELPAQHRVADVTRRHAVVDPLAGPTSARTRRSPTGRRRRMRRRRGR